MRVGFNELRSWRIDKLKSQSADELRNEQDAAIFPPFHLFTQIEH